MEDVEGKKEQNVLTQLAIRSMAKAIYTTKTSSHYGLAFDHYTHFTSPIRRYPDVMVHRLLLHYLNGGQSANAEHYEELCKHSSAMEKKQRMQSVHQLNTNRPNTLKTRLVTYLPA
jgi:ribonuclease R